MYFVQVIHLKSQEPTWLSKHLAHNINTHHEFYQQHDAAIEIAKVGRLIMAADAGEMNKFAGMKLSEIDVSGKFSLCTLSIFISCFNAYNKMVECT